MKTPEFWLDKLWATSNGVTLCDITSIQSDAFAAGERKGRIEGLRWARDVVGTSNQQLAQGTILNELVRLEREQQTKEAL